MLSKEQLYQSLQFIYLCFFLSAFLFYFFLHIPMLTFFFLQFIHLEDDTKGFKAIPTRFSFCLIFL